MLRIGPAGNSVAFYASGRKRTVEAAKWLNEIGLNAFEYSFGRGVSLKAETAKEIGEQMSKYNVAISAHAPYYINLAGSDEGVEKSFKYILQSFEALTKMGGNRLVVHTGSYSKGDKSELVARAGSRYLEVIELLKQKGFKDFYICPETMGKHSQIGDVKETLFLASLSDHLIPCFDFGHINSRSFGKLLKASDFEEIVQRSFDVVGIEKTKKMHVHFSKIMYGQSGEIRHLDFSDTVYGPNFEPFAEIIIKHNLEPVLICESSDNMSDDAITMKKILINLGLKDF